MKKYSILAAVLVLTATMFAGCRNPGMEPTVLPSTHVTTAPSTAAPTEHTTVPTTEHFTENTHGTTATEHATENTHGTTATDTTEHANGNERARGAAPRMG